MCGVQVLGKDGKDGKDGHEGYRVVVRWEGGEVKVEVSDISCDLILTLWSSGAGTLGLDLDSNPQLPSASASASASASSAISYSSGAGPFGRVVIPLRSLVVSSQ